MDVEVKRLTKRYGDVTALDSVSMRAPGARITVVLGPSGSGKTTLLRVIAGLEQQDEGSVFIGGRVVDGLEPWERGVAMVFQEPAILPHMTVEENLLFFGASPGEAREIAELLHIGHLLARKPSALSGGELQRAALAIALARKPRVLLLDEPFSSLDQPLREEMRRLVRSVQRELGVTVVHVTHDQDEALELGDWLILLDHGRVIAEGSPAQVYQEPPGPRVAEFLGHNILCLDGRLASIAPENVGVEPGGPYRLLDMRSQRGRVIVEVEYEGVLLKAYIHPREARRLAGRSRVNVVFSVSDIVVYREKCVGARRSRPALQV